MMNNIRLPLDELAEIGFAGREVEKFLRFTEEVNSVPEVKGREFGHVVDLCAGNGLGAFTFQYNGLAKKSLMSDVRKPPRFNRLSGLFRKYGLSYEYHIKDIHSEDFQLGDLRNDGLIISIHACAELADRVIDIGLNSNVPFAVMPCCHRSTGKKYDLQRPPDPRLLRYEDPADYFDLVRRTHIEESGWTCYWREVPQEITKKNHVLIGFPGQQP